MMKNIKITPKAAQLLRAMIVSCGNLDCFDSVQLLHAIRSVVDYSPIAQKVDGTWRMRVFERLFNFVVEQKETVITSNLVAWYFGGQYHIEIMYRLGGHAGLGEYLGAATGLITHTLLPLDKEYNYKNKQIALQFANYVDLGGEGAPFYHLGVVVRAKIDSKIIETIKEEQAKSEHFLNAVSKINEPIKIPAEYFEALNCTAKKFS